MVRIDTPEALRHIHAALLLAHGLAVTAIPEDVADTILPAIDSALDATEAEGVGCGIILRELDG